MNLFKPPSFLGVDFIVKTAQEQMRTPRDVMGPWVRPRCPSKRAGRKGTRRGWKRKNPPHRVWLFREPTDVLMFEAFGASRVIITPEQLAQIRSGIR